MTTTIQKSEEGVTTIPNQYARVKGADWFPLLYKKPVMVLGQGGIGSHLSFLLSRIGCELYLFDHDVYEEHNMTGQIVKRSSIGMNKAEAMKELIGELSPDCVVETFGEYTPTSPTNGIVLCGFDNMLARRTAFDNWRKHVSSLSEDKRRGCLFMDGRLLAEVMQIISIPGDRTDLMDRYDKEYLFLDGEVKEAECTFKQTSHCASMIGSHMTGFLTNWAFNAEKGRQIRQVPFYFEYMIPLNMTTNERS